MDYHSSAIVFSLNIHSRHPTNTIKSNVVKLYETDKEKIKDILSSIPERISFTMVLS